MSKKLRKILLVLLATVFCAILFALGCSSTSSDGKHTVTFNYITSQIPTEKISVDDGAVVSEPERPVREGYTFIGWSTDVVGANMYDFSTPVNGDLRLFAVWEQNVATVTFMLQDGTVFATRQVDIGSTVSVPEETPVEEGYVFDSWCLSYNGVYAYDFNAPVTGDFTLYATWKQTHATVTFALYGEEIIVERVELGTPVSAPEDPVRLDYAFTGWYSNAICTQPYDFNAPVNNNITIYAGWELTTATITLDYGYDIPDGQVKADVGSTLPEPEEPQRKGYTFTGWYTDEQLTKPYSFSSQVEGNFTLYAGWEIMEYTVTFDYNYQGAPAASTERVTFGDSVAEPADPVRSGYVFIGWYTEAEVTESTEQYDFTLPVEENITLYAGWQTDEGGDTDSIVVRFWLDDAGTQAYGDPVVLERAGRIQEPAQPQRDGYYFAGWTEEPGSGTNFRFTSVVRQSTDLYARWMKGYAFEAEYTELLNKRGQGLSLNTQGRGLIRGGDDPTSGIRPLDNQEEAGLSNGYVVNNLFYNGAFIEFKITASEAVTDGVLVLRLTPYIHDMILSNTEWQVVVNGRALDASDGYTGVTLTGAIPESGYTSPSTGLAAPGEHNYRPFENYLITRSLDLNAGENVIRLVTNNSKDHGATFNAETPTVDCMYIYADAVLSWTVCYPENVYQTMADVDYVIEYNYSATATVTAYVGTREFVALPAKRISDKSAEEEEIV
mgnify:CR=1 FL=1